MKTAANIFTELRAGMTAPQTLDATANPNYPAAQEGDKRKITNAGKVGGASGKSCGVDDIIYCVNTSVTGDEAAVGKNWVILPKKAIEFFNGK